MELQQTIVTIAPPTSSHNNSNNNGNSSRSARVKPSLPKFCQLARSASLNEEGTAAPHPQLRIGGGSGGGGAASPGAGVVGSAWAATGWLAALGAEELPAPPPAVP